MSNNSYYEREALDFRVVKGDTLLIPLSFNSSSGAPIDVTSFQMRFTVRDAITDDIIEMLTGVTTHSLDHEKDTTTGRGISFYGDTDLGVKGLAIDAVNKIVIVLESTNTSLFRRLPHVWELEMTADLQRKSSIKGRIIVDRELQ